ncbi:MAG: tetraacyldisaccharide 4'-kinase [Prevotellaceae bacterium]|jgi:tetraacyldisaccharide 4'-kinase|nr:tetraacyldisaccharide 4'-kinase [Prevotellaceae bacterium]
MSGNKANQGTSKNCFFGVRLQYKGRFFGGGWRCLQYPLLAPLAAVYGAAVVIRNKLYDCGLFASRKFEIPLISVGNITVGGTGKTPHIEYLVGILSRHFKVAVLSRGYKRQSRGFQYVEIGDSVLKTGDEPLQIKCKYPDITVAVDADRAQGIRKLQEDFPDLEVVLLDDAFQHRQITPSLNIVLIDCNRPVWNDAMMPAGKLRDCCSSLNRADVFIVSKCPETLSQDERSYYINKLKKYNKPVYFSSVELGKEYPVSEFADFDIDAADSAMPLNPPNITALTGIANPASFYAQLSKRFPDAAIEKTAFPDHHNFTEKEMQTILKKTESHTIVTTEKDSVRLISYFCATKKRPLKGIYCIPISIKIDNSHDFNINIIEHVRKNKKDGGVYKG